MTTESRALLCLAGCVAIAGTTQGASVTAEGIVFVDRNGDGIRQTAERGLPGVLVSDGRQVVETDELGRYTLEIDKDDSIVFVIKPDGYQTPLDHQNKPEFYYIHKPAGSLDAGFNFPGVEPTGELPVSIDFPLIAEPEGTSDSFSVAFFGDPQPYTQEQVSYFRGDVIDPFLGRVVPFEFGVSLGDLVGDQLDLFEPLNEAQSLLGVPWYNVYGNHDMNFLAGLSSETADDPDRHADETFNRVYGPTDYAFQRGSVHFIVLDNVIYQGFKGWRDGEAKGWPQGKRPVTNNYRGGLRDDQIEFVSNYLSYVPSEDLVVLMFHVPIEMDGEGVHRIPEKRALFEALSGHPHTLSISGHTHIQRHWFFGREDGYAPDPSVQNQHSRRDADRFSETLHHHINAVTASGSWFRGPKDEDGLPLATMACGAPNGYTLIHFNGAEYRSEFRAARAPADHQMRLSVTETGRGGHLLMANVFNGAAGDAVQYRVIPWGADADQISWRSMQHTRMPDPVYNQLWQAHSQIPSEYRDERPLPRPQMSSHIWTAPINGPLPAGTHIVEVRHTDLYGVTRIDRQTIRPEVDTLP